MIADHSRIVGVDDVIINLIFRFTQRAKISVVNFDGHRYSSAAASAQPACDQTVA